MLVKAFLSPIFIGVKNMILCIQIRHMYCKSIILIAVIIALQSCQTASQKFTDMEHEHTNELVHETSPYLLQHAHNPVDWHAWNDAALKKAKDEDKLIIISVGYSACHWCHVMEHESFEDSTVAAIMNEHFVPIKVDREERPDIDDVYMTACHLSNQRGCGWPLNAFALPDGRPIWAGTYFPKDQWLDILNQFHEMKLNASDKLVEYAEQLEEGYRSVDAVDIPDENADLNEIDMPSLMQSFVSQMDPKFGGRKGAPKFPMPNNQEMLLKWSHLNNNRIAGNIVNTTLSRMAEGGIFDPIAGGFARYSTDAEWKVPHFEKMMYDNGQLLDLYSYAYKMYENPLYKKTIDKTVGWIASEMIDKSGGIYSALDADSDGEEGKFYVWTNDEITSAISDETDLLIFKKRYDIKPSGNWEHDKNILHAKKTIENLSKSIGKTESEIDASIEQSLKKLGDIRSKRIRPGLDDKILTSWNALATHGLIEAYFATGNETAKNIAENNIKFLLEKQVQENGQLWRNYKNGKSTINAFLDDYALLIRVLMRYYEMTFDEQYLMKAEAIMSFAIQHFSDDESGLFYYTSDLDAPLVTRKRELSDNVIPASNSIMARNLLRLGLYLYKPEFIERARRMGLSMKTSIETGNQPSYYSNWLQLYTELSDMPYEIAILGPDAKSLSEDLQSNYLPNSIMLGGTDEGTLKLLKDKLQDGVTMIYVCQNKVCKFPVEDVGAALELME